MPENFAQFILQKIIKHKYLAQKNTFTIHGTLSRDHTHNRKNKINCPKTHKNRSNGRLQDQHKNFTF